MQKGRVIVQDAQFALILRRLTQQLVENHLEFENTCIIGVQPRGVALSNRIIEILKRRHRLYRVDYGLLDITFYRDDFRRREKPLVASSTEMDFIVEDKNVILIDDVLYTGRTIQAAMTALANYGRPRRVELLTLVDRRFNRHLPIQADYSGIIVDSMDEAYVKVCWSEQEGTDEIILYPRIEE